MGGVTRSAYFLAALASAALPGLDPVSVRAVRGRPGEQFDLAFVEDDKERSWVVQAPRTSVAGAMLEDVAELSTLLGRRLDIAVPMIRGQAVVPEGRAVVYPRLPGRPLDFAGLPEGLGLAAELGRALAHIHNLEVELFEEAGRPSYDAEATRSRLLTDLDRAAATGHVPTGLLSRWEHALEDVSLWRFLPTPVHGSLVGSNVLASFDDEDDAGAGRVRAVLGWEESHVGDPAEDFADLAACSSAGALESVLDAYGPSRIDRPDPHLLDRARLASELRLVRRLLRALAAEERTVVEQAAQDLRSLEERVFSAGSEEPLRVPPPATPLRRVLLSEEQPSLVAGPADPPAGTEPPPSPTPSPSSSTRPRTAPAHLDTVAVPLKAGPATDSDRAETNDVDSDRVETRAETSSEDSRRRQGGSDQPGTGPLLSAVHFEIDEAEPLTAHAADPTVDAAGPVAGEDGAVEDDDGVLDLHEGASEFVRVEPRPRGSTASG